MPRIFKNAVFPILVVILLAFLAQRLLLNGDSSGAPPRNWSTLLSNLETGRFATPADAARAVVESDGDPILGDVSRGDFEGPKEGLAEVHPAIFGQ